MPFDRTGPPQREIDWNRTAVLLICPDALIRHLAVPILKRLIQNDFCPFYHQLVGVTPEGIDHLYQAIVIETWETKLYRQLLALYSLGPCLCVLLRDAGDGREPMHHRLTRLKGPSDPLKATRGTIRRDLVAINTILHLLHTSDSPEESRSNAFYLLGPDTIRSIEAQGRWDREPSSEALDFCRLLMLGSRPETRGFPEVLAGFRTKLCIRLWDQFMPSGRSLISDWARQHSKAFARIGAGTQLVEHLTHREHPLAPLLACEFRPGGPRVDLETMLLRLAGEGVLVDRWEALVLSSSSLWAPAEGEWE